VAEIMTTLSSYDFSGLGTIDVSAEAKALGGVFGEEMAEAIIESYGYELTQGIDAATG
jgi:hypothetical protein